MNVGPGDLALILTSGSNAGKVVTVITRSVDHPTLGPCWRVEAPTLLKIEKGYARQGICPDSRLRLIKGVDMDNQKVQIYDENQKHKELQNNHLNDYQKKYPTRTTKLPSYTYPPPLKNRNR